MIKIINGMVVEEIIDDNETYLKIKTVINQHVAKITNKYGEIHKIKPTIDETPLPPFHSLQC